MLAQFPMMKAADVVKLLEHFGFKRIRVHGSHWIFFNEVTNKQTVVSMHKKDIPKGTFFEILKQANISKEELKDYLN